MINAIKLRRSGFDPLYVQIEEEIERRIERRDLQPGAFLPPEHRMAGMLKVHRNTVRAAYERLKMKGLVVAEQGRGWRVAPTPAQRIMEIGFLAAGLQHHVALPAYRRTLDALTLEAHQRDLDVVSFLICDNEEDIVRALQRRRLSALVVAGHVISQKIWQAVMALPCRRIALDSYPDNPCTHYVITDHREGGRMAAERLLESGHDRFVLVMPYSEKGWVFRGFDERREGFLNALHEAEVPSRHVLELYPDVSNPATIPPVARQIVEFGEGVGVFCTLDRLALRLIRCLQDLGKNLPDDLSLIGFDGDPEGQHQHPTLATFAHPVQAIARHVVDLTLSQPANGLIGPGEIRIPPIFQPGETLRESRTAAAAGN